MHDNQKVADELFMLAADRVKSAEERNHLKILPPELADDGEILSIVPEAKLGATATSCCLLAFTTQNAESENWRSGSMVRLSLIGVVNPAVGLSYVFTIITGWFEYKEELQYVVDNFTKEVRGIARIVNVFEEDGKHRALVDIGLKDMYVFTGRTESAALTLAEMMMQDDGYIVVSWPWEIDQLHNQT